MGWENDMDGPCLLATHSALNKDIYVAFCAALM